MMKSPLASQQLSSSKHKLRLVTSIIVIALVTVSTPIVAQDTGDDYALEMPDVSQVTPLNEADLLAAFTDKTHQGTYNFRRPNIDTFEFEETTTSDGRTRHVHGPKVDTGTWRVKANVICFHYEGWQGELDHFACFNIYKQGNCFYHYGLSGFGRGGGNFTARSVHKGDVPDCVPSFV